MTPDIRVPPSWKSTLAMAGSPTLENERKQDLHDRLAEYGQQHVLKFWDRLSPSERGQLAAQIDQLDLELLSQLFRPRNEESSAGIDPSLIAEPAGVTLNDQQPRFTESDARKVGSAMLDAGTIGVTIVAGGQGTRLGFPHPKGMYPIGPLSGVSLFEIHFNKVLAASRRCGRSIPIYLMTSTATHDETIQFLDQHDRFGFPAEDLVIFCQGEMPAVDQETGKLLMADEHSLCLSPDGHGGMLGALAKSKAFDDMRRRGIEHLFYLQIDNPMVDVCATAVLGNHVLFNSQATTLVTRKTVPTERVGVVAQYDGKMRIVEYSELSPEMTAQKREDGCLLLWAGNMAVHVWDVSFLESLAFGEGGLPFHGANKKVAHLDDAGNQVTPADPNAVKFERFIFDLLPIARRSIVIEVDRDTQFAPLKNPPGTATDSPEYVQQAILNLHRSWLLQAGANLADGVDVEVHPSFADNGDSLASRIPAGAKILENTVLQ